MPLSLLLPKFPETYLPKNFTLLIAMSRHCPQNLPEFDPYSPSIHIADLRDFIYWMNPHVIIPNNFKLDDYRKTAYKLLHPTEDRPSRNRSSSSAHARKNKTHPTSPKPQRTKELLVTDFDPDNPNLQISDLKEFITHFNPNAHITNKACLRDLCEMARNLTIPTWGRSPQPRRIGLSGTPQSKPRLASPSPKPKELIGSFITKFNPDDINLRISDLKEFINQVSPSTNIPVRITLKELRAMAHEVTYIPRGCAPLSNTPKPRNLREALLAAFDPNAPGMRIADLKEFITQLSPGTPIPTKVRLGELREIACNLIQQRSKSAETSPRSIKEFNPYASHIRKADLQEFIYKNNPDSRIPGNIMLAELREMADAIIHPQTVHSQVSQPRCKIPQSNSSYHVPSNVTLVELKNMTYRLIHPHRNLPQTSQDQNKRPQSRAGSPAQPGLRSRSALPHLKSIWNFDPYASHICKAYLQEVILQIDPSCHIPSNTRLSELRDMVYRMIHPQSVPALASKATKKRPQSRATSPACPGLRMRSALPALKNINTFDPYASHIRKADLQEFILQIDPSSHIPSNTRRAELRDMAYRMIHPQSAPRHASNVQASQSRASSPAQPGHRTRSASPAIISIKNFDPYAPHVKKADLREVIFQIDPCSHVPRNIGLSALRDLVYQMIHPCTVNPQASNADKVPQSRAASPAQSELRLRSDQLPSRSIKNFDPYAPHINKADLREVIFQIDSNSQIPNNIRLAELRNMAFRMIHPHDSLPQEDFEFDHFDPYDSNVQLSHLREFIFKMDPNCHIPSDVRLPHLCDLAYRLLSPSIQACPSAPAPSVNYSSVRYPSTSRKSQSPHRVQFSDQHMPFTGKQIHSNVSSQKTFTHDVEIGNEYGQCSSGKSTANEDHNEISDESQESNGSAGSKDNNNKFEVSSDDLSDSSKSIVQRGCLKKQRLLKSQSSEAGTPGTSKQKTGSSIHQQVIIDHSSSDHSSDPPTYHCNRKRYFNRVPVPPDVEFMMETKGLEYGFTLSDESTTKSLHHSKPKISHKSSNQSKSSTSKAQNKKNNKQKTSSSIHQQVIIDHSSSDHSSDPSTYHCNRKHYLNGVPVPPDVEFTMETDGLETGSTLSNKSTTKSSHHSKPKSSHECPKSSHLGTDSIPCKVFPDLIDFSGPNQFTTFPSSSNALLPAIRPSTSKIDQPPTLTHNCVSSPLPFAPPRPPKPPALCPSQLDRVHQLPAVQSNFCFQSNETIPESGVKIVDHNGFIKALFENPLQDQLTAKAHHLAIVKNVPSNLSEMPPVQDFLTTEKSNSLSSKCSAGNNTTIPTKLPTTMQHIDLPGADCQKNLFKPEENRENKKTNSLITNPMNVSLTEKQISGGQSRRSLEHPGPIKSMPKRPNVGLFATTNTNLEACELERQFPPHNEAVLQSHLHLESVPINFGEPTSFGIASIQGSLLIAPAPIPISKNTTTSLAIAPAPIPISKSATANSIMSSNSIIHDKNLQQSSSLQSGNLDAFPAVLNPSVELEQPNTTLGIVTQSERLFKSDNVQLSASTILTHNPWATKKEFKPVPLTPPF
ncbi:hypothetical protein BY996DRAFT_6417212 [Phakopsora pachyrhizi]|nr:hypothetical protein BY996DRAFT_6417212 [Phakopsora pachyrhizi]